MKKNDVELGATYAAKVSGKRVHVRIEREGAHGGWEAVIVASGRKIHVKSAQRLRRAVTPRSPTRRDSEAPARRAAPEPDEPSQAQQQRRVGLGYRTRPQ